MCENCSVTDMEKVFNDENVDLGLMDPIVERFKHKKGSLINILQEMQDIYGFLPLSAMNYVSENTKHKKASIYGVATFYTQFRLKPIGKYLILQCQGTACHVNGSKEISKVLCEELNIQPGDTTEDGMFTIEDVACLGCCSLAPVIMINDEAYGNLTPASAVQVIKDIKAKEEDSE